MSSSRTTQTVRRYIMEGRFEETTTELDEVPQSGQRGQRGGRGDRDDGQLEGMARPDWHGRAPSADSVVPAPGIQYVTGRSG